MLLLAGTTAAQQAPQPPGRPNAVPAPAVQSFSYQKKAQVPPAPWLDTGQEQPTEVLPVAPRLVAQPKPSQPPARTEGPFPGFPLAEDAPRFQVQLEPPGPQRLFRLESEAQLRRRMEQEGKERSPREKILFPDEPVVSRDTYRGRHWPPQNLVVEPNYVCHGRLLFQQLNAERYGWDLGPIHPFVSVGVFVTDALTLPYNVGKFPCRKYDCSAGLCLPGDPVPLLLYPPEWSLTGLVTQAAVVGALLVAFP